MLKVAVKNLLYRKVRLFLSVLAIALAMVLILVVDGFAAGMFDQVTVIYREVDADLWVVQSGVEGIMTSMSSLPGNLRDGLADAEGVDEVHEILSIPTIFEYRDDKTPINLIGFHVGEIGGPWRIGEGRSVRANDEVVLDTALARQNDIEIGDQVDIMGGRFRAVGLSLGTASWMTPFVFLSEQAASELLEAGDIVSVFLLTTDAETNPTDVKDDIDDAFPIVDVFNPQQLEDKERDVMASLLGNVLNLVTAIAFGVGILVVGLTVYTTVVERISDYGILKSIGASAGRLYFMVLVQAIIITAFGFLVGAFLSVYAGMAIEALLPQFEISIGTASIIRGGIAAIGVAVITSYIPTRRIASIDPSLVFRG